MTTVLSLYTFQDVADALVADATWTANSAAWTAYALAANVPGPLSGTTGFDLLSSTLAAGATKYGAPTLVTTADFQSWVNRQASLVASNQTSTGSSGSSLTDTTTASTSGDGSDPTTTTPTQTAPAPATTSSSAGPVVAVAAVGLAAGLAYWLW